jgi:hypothetical protein
MPRRRKTRAERLVVTRFSCKFLLDEWDVELEWLGRAATPRAADDGDGSLIPVVGAR